MVYIYNNQNQSQKSQATTLPMQEVDEQNVENPKNTKIGAEDNAEKKANEL